MEPITIVTYILFVIFLSLLLKARYFKSILGKRAGTILYTICTGVYLGLFCASVNFCEIKAANIRLECNKPVESTMPINRVDRPGTVYGGTVSNKINLKSKSIGQIIGDVDSKIYHVPGSTYYEREMKKTSNNVYFKTVKEAIAAGYRAPMR